MKVNRLIMPLHTLRYVLFSGLVLMLSACGFHLRGVQALPFETVYIDLPGHSEMRGSLVRQIQQFSETKVITDPKMADARILILNERNNREQLTLDGLGRVRDFDLFYTLEVKVVDRQGQEIIPATEISARREITNNDAELIAKEFERNQLIRDMQLEIAQRLMRRLQALD